MYCVCGYVCVCVWVCVCVACSKMLKGIQVRTHTHTKARAHTHTHTHTSCLTNVMHITTYYCLSTLFLVWHLGPCSDHGLPLLGGFDSIKVLRGTVVSPTPNPQQSWRTDGLLLSLVFHHQAAWHGRTCQELLYHQNSVVRHWKTKAPPPRYYCNHKQIYAKLKLGG